MAVATELSRFPTKQEEIDHYTQFVAALPRVSYLAGILRDTVGCVAEMIGSDLAFPEPLHRLWQQQTEAETKLRKLQEEIKTSQVALRHLRIVLDNERGKLRDLASSADLIAKHIRKTVTP